MRKFIVNNLQYELYDKIDFSEIKFDFFGCKILAELIKKCENVNFLRLNKCKFPEKGLQEIINSLNTFDDFYTVDLSDVKFSLNNLKHISQICKESQKKKIIYDDIALNGASGKNPNKQTKVVDKMKKKFSEFSFK